MKPGKIESYPAKMGESVHFLPKNTKGRDFVVGDIHGCTDAFWATLDRIGFQPDRDRVFSVGDLIDRGPDSTGALNLLNHHWFFAVRGNHEQMMLDAVRHDDSRALRMWMSNGGKWATELPTQILEALCDVAEQLPLAIVVGEGLSRFNVIHAEFAGSDAQLDSGNWSSTIREQILWGRSLISSDFFPSHNQLSTTYCGHTVVDDVIIKGGHVFLDTGAYLADKSNTFKNGRLTVVTAIPNNQSLCKPAN